MGREPASNDLKADIGVHIIWNEPKYHDLCLFGSLMFGFSHITLGHYNMLNMWRWGSTNFHLKGRVVFHKVCSLDDFPLKNVIVFIFGKQVFKWSSFKKKKKKKITFFSHLVVTWEMTQKISSAHSLLR